MANGSDEMSYFMQQLMQERAQQGGYQLGLPPSAGLGDWQGNADYARQQWMRTNQPEMYDSFEDHRQAMIDSGFASLLGGGQDPMGEMVRKQYEVTDPDPEDFAGIGLEAAKKQQQKAVKDAYQLVIRHHGSPEKYQLHHDSQPPELQSRDWPEAAERIMAEQVAQPSMQAPSPGFDFSGGPGPSRGQASFEPGTFPQYQRAQPVPEPEPVAAAPFEPLWGGIMPQIEQHGREAWEGFWTPTHEWERRHRTFSPHTAQAWGFGPERRRHWEDPQASMPPEETVEPMAPEDIRSAYGLEYSPGVAGAPVSLEPFHRVSEEAPEELPADSLGEQASLGVGGRVPLMGTSLPTEMLMGAAPGGPGADGYYPMPLERFVPEVGLAEAPQLEYDEGRFDIQSTSTPRVDGKGKAAVTLEDGTKAYYAYKDTVGLRTIGVGFNLEQKGAAEILMNAGIPKDLEELKTGKDYLTEEESHRIFLTMLPGKEKIARSWVGQDVWDKLTKDRQQVLLNMSFNMRLGKKGAGKGKPGGITSLPRLLEKAVNSGMQEDYDAAADKMLGYHWADQVKGRAHRLAERMRGRTGAGQSARQNYMTMSEGGLPPSFELQMPESTFGGAPSPRYPLAPRRI